MILLQIDANITKAVTGWSVFLIRVDLVRSRVLSGPLDWSHLFNMTKHDNTAKRQNSLCIREFV